MSRAHAAAAALLAPVLVLAACGPAQSEGADAPSILVILIDALRPDHLGAYGYERPTSPTLDALAAESIVFDDAASVSSWTKPSIPSLFTSLYPVQHGVYEGSAHAAGGALESDILPDSALTLAEALGGCGFDTAAFVHNAQLRGEFGFAQGFDLYEESGDDAEPMVDRLLDWLGRRGARPERPFFAYLHLLDVHWPYEPPAGAARRLGLQASGAADDRALREAVNQGLVELSEARRRELIGRYDAEILGVDDAVGRLRRRLSELDLEERLVVLVTADHGEAFLEHGSLGHGGDLYEESLRIPMILRLPDGTGAGSRRAGRVSLLDVMPTQLGLAGCAVPAHLEGSSLLASPAADSPAAGPVVAEVRHKRVWRQAVVRDGWKLIRTERRPAAAPAGAPAADPASRLIGLRAEVEGMRLEGDRFYAEEIEIEAADDDDDEVTGTLEAIDHDRRRATVLGFAVDWSRALVQGPDRGLLDAAALRPGSRVKIEGRADGPAAFLADKLRLVEEDADVELEGIVRPAEPPEAEGPARVRIAGLQVILPADVVEEALGDGDDGRRPAEGGPAPAAEVQIELYHLQADPGERRDLSGRQPEAVARLLGELDAWLQRASSRSLPRQARAAVDEETVRQLRALGYVQ